MSLHPTVTFARSHELLEDSHRFLANGAASTLRLTLKSSPFFMSQGHRLNVFGGHGNEFLFTGEESRTSPPSSGAS